jgi:hypothetical protein
MINAVIVVLGVLVLGLITEVCINVLTDLDEKTMGG